MRHVGQVVSGGGRCTFKRRVLASGCQCGVPLRLQVPQVAAPPAQAEEEEEAAAAAPDAEAADAEPSGGEAEEAAASANGDDGFEAAEAPLDLPQTAS